jgi:transposase
MIPAGTRVYFAMSPADLRRSFDGLAALAASALARDPAHGGLFVFVNKRGNQVRILFRDPHGWCILAKRLDKGRFRRPRVQDGCFCWETDAPTLMAFLDDIDLSRMYRKHKASTSVRYLEVVRSKTQ